MAVDYTPSVWVTGLDVSSTYLAIPWTSLGDAAQNETDIREILKGLADTINTHYETLSGDDVPTKFIESSQEGYVDSELFNSYVWKFNSTIDTSSLADEPT